MRHEAARAFFSRCPDSFSKFAQNLFLQNAHKIELKERLEPLCRGGSLYGVHKVRTDKGNSSIIWCELFIFNTFRHVFRELVSPTGRHANKPRELCNCPFTGHWDSSQQHVFWQRSREMLHRFLLLCIYNEIAIRVFLGSELCCWKRLWSRKTIESKVNKRQWNKGYSYMSRRLFKACSSPQYIQFPSPITWHPHGILTCHCSRRKKHFWFSLSTESEMKKKKLWNIFFLFVVASNFSSCWLAWIENGLRTVDNIAKTK